MKNVSLFLIFLGILLTQHVFAQPVANDDVATHPVNGITGGTAINSVKDNDFLNGNPIAVCNAVVFSQVSAPIPGIAFSNSCGMITVQQGTPTGTYTVTYKICAASDTSICDTATATIYVCSLPTPLVTVTQFSCTAMTGSLNFTGLPSGNWTLTRYTAAGAFISSFEGSGSTYLLGNLPEGEYYYNVTDASGCKSATIHRTVDMGANLNVNANGTFVDVNTNGFINAGDWINYQYVVSNNGVCDMTDIELAETGSGQLTILSNHIDVLHFLQTDYTTIKARHVVTQQDVDQGFVHLDRPVHGWYNGNQEITINVVRDMAITLPDGFMFISFLDSNSNYARDPGEPGFADGRVEYEINNDGIPRYAYSADGTYIQYETNPNNHYVVKYTVNPAYASYYTSVFEYGGWAETNAGVRFMFFPIQPIPFNDLEVQLFAGATGPSPNANYTNTIRYRNSGSQPMSGTVAFNKDNRVAIAAISESGTIATPTGFTYDFTDLQPQESRFINVTLSVPPLPTVAIGDALTQTATITLPDGDIHPGNNVAQLTQHVLAGYDPNNKTESHGGQVLHAQFTESDFMTYTIHFENTSANTALHVKVTDVLDEKLDENSVRTVASSHPYLLERIGNTVTWKFNGINLPPSGPVPPNLGKGFIVFEVKPKPGYAVGDIISNTANIYLDDAVLATDACLTEFVSVLGSDSFAQNDISIYPNPTENIVNISFKGNNISSIAVTDMLGKKVFSENTNRSQATVDLSHLSSGLYLLKVNASGKQQTFKLMKR